MDNRAVPTLSSKGWVVSPTEKADLILSYFFLSEYSRSFLYYGEISSLPYLLQTYNGDIGTLRSKLITSVHDLMQRYFDEVSVDVDIADLSEEPGRFTIRLGVNFQSEGQSYDLAKALPVYNGRLAKIFELINQGNPNHV